MSKVKEGKICDNMEF